MKKQKTNIERKSEKESTTCSDEKCNIHGMLRSHGRTFEGTVTKKFQKRIVIEFERMIYIRKYERYSRAKSKIHARLPSCRENEVQVGDYVKVQECRPLSKLIHFVFIEKIRGGEKKK